MSEQELTEGIEKIESPDKKKSLLAQLKSLVRKRDFGVVDVTGFERGKHDIKKEIDDLP